MFISIIKNNVKATSVAIESIEALASVIQQEVWAAATFKANRRNKANFKETNLVVLDIDSGCTLEQAKDLFNSYKHIIGTTRSHNLEKNGVIADRFRVILFLDNVVTSSALYGSLYKSLQLKYPFIDTACSDSSRQWYPCTSVQSINSNGSLIEVGNTGAIEAEEIQLLDRGAMTYETNPSQIKNTTSIYKYLSDNKQVYFFKSKIDLKKVAKFLAMRVTGLMKGRERMNQQSLAKALKLHKTSVRRLLKRLTKAGLIRLKHPPITGVDSAVYEAGPELLKLLKAQPGPLKGQPKTVTKRQWTDGKAAKQMLADIRACKTAGLNQFQALEVLKNNQAHRPVEKQRSSVELMAAIEAWYQK